MNNVNKLVLGTAQFGMKYGINNSIGQVAQNDVNEILNLAEQCGVEYIDTAYGYGNSEKILGFSPALHRGNFKIISKYANSKLSPINQFYESIKHLNKDKIYAYMIHNFSTYVERPAIWNDFLKLKEDALVEKIGFSLYSTYELEYILEHNIAVDIIQVPYNLLDRQFEKFFEILNDKGIEIHTRSVFLQGIFFKDINTFEGKIEPLAKYVQKIQQYCQTNKLNIQDIALGYVLSSISNGVLIGVDSLSQFKENILSSNYNLSRQDLEFIRSMNVIETNLLSPVNW